MKRVTITVDTNEQVAQVEEALKRLDFISSIEKEDLKLSDEEIGILEERLEDYEKNRNDILQWDDVMSELISKYGK